MYFTSENNDYDIQKKIWIMCACMCLFPHASDLFIPFAMTFLLCNDVCAEEIPPSCGFFLSREKLVEHHEGVLSQAQPVYSLHCTTPNATAVEEELKAEWHVLLREQLKFPRWVFMGQEISCFGRLPYNEHLALADRVSIDCDFCGFLIILRRKRLVESGRDLMMCYLLLSHKYLLFS